MRNQGFFPEQFEKLIIRLQNRRAYPALNLRLQIVIDPFEQWGYQHYE